MDFIIFVVISLAPLQFSLIIIPKCCLESFHTMLIVSVDFQYILYSHCDESCLSVIFPVSLHWFIQFLSFSLTTSSL